MSTKNGAEHLSRQSEHFGLSSGSPTLGTQPFRTVNWHGVHMLIVDYILYHKCKLAGKTTKKFVTKLVVYYDYFSESLHNAPLPLTPTTIEIEHFVYDPLTPFCIAASNVTTSGSESEDTPPLEHLRWTKEMSESSLLSSSSTNTLNVKTNERKSADISSIDSQAGIGANAQPLLPCIAQPTPKTKWKRIQHTTPSQKEKKKEDKTALAEMEYEEVFWNTIQEKHKKKRHSSTTSENTTNTSSETLDSGAYPQQTTSTPNNLLELKLCKCGLDELPKSVLSNRKLMKLHAKENNLFMLPFSIIKLRNLRELVLSRNQFREFPRVLLLMTSLATIDISYNKIAYIPHEIDSLISLARLKLNRNKIKHLPHSIGNLSNLEVLDISSNMLRDIPSSLGNCLKLRQLSFARNPISKWPERITKLTNLETLLCHSTLVSLLPPSITIFQKLKRINFGHNNLEAAPVGISRLTSLESLQMSETQLPFPNGLKHLTNISVLSAAGNRITVIPKQLALFTNLTYLDLSHNDIDVFPVEFCRLTNLTHLSLSHNKIREVPVEVSNFRALKLFLSKNNIWFLPPQLANIDFGENAINLDVSGNPLGAFPEEVRSHNTKGAPLLIKYLKNLKKKEQWRRVKLVLVGEEFVGKTSLRLQLLRNANRRAHQPELPTGDQISKKERVRSLDSGETAVTDGIEIDEWEPDVDNINDRLFFSCWDFAGQDLYLTTHQFFLSRRSICIVVFNLLDEKSSKVEYWLKTLKIRANGAPVVIVGTHRDDKRCDKKYREQVINSMRRRYDPRFPFIRAYVTVSCKSGKGINSLISVLLELGKSFATEEVPRSYLLLEGRLRLTRLSRQVMHYQEFRKYVKECGVPEKKIPHCLKFMTDAGVIVHFDDPSSGLKELVILDPQWIIDLMASIITLKHSYARDGILPIESLPHIWKEYPREQYEWLLKLLEKFEISFRVDSTVAYAAGIRRVHSANDLHETNLQTLQNYPPRDSISSLSKLSKCNSASSVHDSPSSSKTQANKQTITKKVEALDLQYTIRTSPRTRSISQSPTPGLSSSSPNISSERKNIESLVVNYKLGSSLPSMSTPQISTERGGIIIVPSLLPDKPDKTLLYKHWEEGRSNWESITGRTYKFKFLPLGFFGRLIVRTLHLPKLRPLYYWKNGMIVEIPNQRALIEYNEMEYQLDLYVKRSSSSAGTSADNSTSLMRQLIENIETLIIGWYMLRPTVFVPCSHCLTVKYLTANPATELQVTCSIPKVYKRPPQIIHTSSVITSSLFNPSDKEIEHTTTNEPTNQSKAVENYDATSQTSNVSTLSSQSRSYAQQPSYINADSDAKTSSSNNDAVVPFYFPIEECMLAVREGKKTLTCVRISKVDKGVVSKLFKKEKAKESREIHTAVAISDLCPDIALTDVENLAIDFSSIELVDRIAEGAYAALYKGRMKSTGKIVAVKILKTDERQDNNLLSEGWRSLQHETFLMKGLKHPNLVELLGICVKPLSMIMDFFELGALNRYLHDPNAKKFTWKYRVKVALDIAKGMLYLHNEDIIHRDLRSPNILVSSLSDTADVVVKVADFGMSVICAPHMAGGDFNELWTAPEIFKGEKYTVKVDQYSFGIILWELLQLGMPFKEYSARFAGKPRLDFFEAVIGGLRPTIPSNCPRVYATLIQQCWALDPDARPTFATIVETLQGLLKVCDTWDSL